MSGRYQARRPRAVSPSERSGDVGTLVADLLDASSAADQIVARGQDAWDGDQLLRLAGEAVTSRIGDAASKLPDDVRAARPSIARVEIRANRVLVAHTYYGIDHRIDYAILWGVLSQDLPRLAEELQRRGARAVERERRSRAAIELGSGTDLGL